MGARLAAYGCNSTTLGIHGCAVVPGCMLFQVAADVDSCCCRARQHAHCVPCTAPTARLNDLKLQYIKRPPITQCCHELMLQQSLTSTAALALACG